MSTIAPGDTLPELTVTADLATSVRYAGASGDLNPLHFDPSFAAEVSPTGGIIAHGMYSMGLVSRQVTAFAGGPEAVVDLQVRFTRPWPLGTTSTFTGKVTKVEDGIATLALAATNASGDRIVRGTATIRV